MRRYAILAGLVLLAGVLALAVRAYFRPVEQPEPAHDQANTAPAHPGLTEAFGAEVKKVGQLSPDEFARRYESKARHLPKVTWDPTTGKHWDRFALAPGEKGYPEDLPKGAMASFDFRLNEAELALFKKNGFVVSERMGSHSFTDLYYRIYVRDLPVFITCDSILHAWHRFFDRMLEDLEHDLFKPSIEQILAAMSNQIADAQRAYGKGPIGASLPDVDFFLAVARDLLKPGSGQSRMGQQERVNAAVQACQEGQMTQYTLFGRRRPIDFSQFKPRGRYDEHEWTKDYFRAMMWLGRIDFRIAGTDDPEQARRELAGAVVLNDLLERSRMRQRWNQLDRALLRLVGRSDSLNFSQLGVVLTALEATDPARLTVKDLAALHDHIQESNIGEQHIRGEWFLVNPSDPRPFALPRSFAFMGQRFVLDSWALSKVVYDDIVWENEKVHRRIPSCLDVSFAVLGNDHVVQTLTGRMKDTTGRKFRDGLPYQHNLAAVRNLVDRMPESTWKESVYTEWLGCLRELSRPTTDRRYPEAVRTSAWADKSTMTQLASWTQLRHDTVLYAKPSYSSGELCYYPAGYVEPVPHFWRRFEEMVKRTQGVIERTTFPDDQHKEQGKHLCEKHLGQLKRFATAVETLRAIADKQAAQQELTKEQTKFLKDVVVRGGGSGRPPVSGWYPNLFSRRSTIKDQDDAHKWVALVTDVHTDPPAVTVPDPGCVLHQAVGNVDAVIIAIDNGKDRMVYAGGVFSHYEFEAPNAVRRTNGDWHTTLREGRPPQRPAWTRSFVVPGVNPEAKTYGLKDNRWGGER